MIFCFGMITLIPVTLVALSWSAWRNEKLADESQRRIDARIDDIHAMLAKPSQYAPLPEASHPLDMLPYDIRKPICIMPVNRDQN